MAGQSNQSDTAGTRRPVWLPKRLDALLVHLDANKGDNGLYMRDRSSAYDGAVEHLAQMTDLKPVSRTQITQTLSSLWGKEQRSCYKNQSFDTLFQQGRQALNSHCQKAELERKVREGWQGLRRGPKKSTSVVVTAGSPRTLSPSKNQTSAVSRNPASLVNPTASALGKRGMLSNDCSFLLDTTVHDD